MEYRFVIMGRLDGMNEYTAANRENPRKGGRMKQDNQDTVIWSIRQQIPAIRIEKPVVVGLTFYEPNKRRDKDNILSCGLKFILDSLVKCGVLQGDGWKHIENFTHDFYEDKDNPRIEVTLTEVEYWT